MRSLMIGIYLLAMCVFASTALAQTGAVAVGKGPGVAGAMQTISSITLETSAGAHETAQTIEGMVGLADRLNKAISQFRVKDDYIHPFSYDVSGSAGRQSNGSNFARYGQGD